MSQQEPVGRHNDRFAEWDAAYVLGSLSPKDRHDFEEHLSLCGSCRKAVTELAGLPGILAALPVGQAEELLAPPPPPHQSAAEVLPLLADRVRRDKRRKRLFTAVAGLAVAAAAVAVTVVVVPRESQAQTQQALAVPLNFTAVDAANFTVTGKALPVAWGTQLEWVCKHFDGGSGQPYYGSGSNSYQLVVTDKQGQETVAASWKSTKDPEIFPVATIMVPVSQIAKIEVRWADTGEVAVRAQL
ncbi:anti-sigma factor family protein [Psychromicrobium sp. YIM B11713]|uniref:anti-sigma factor family protein n=1 Tax=Psychromicrobium sp. YIM B11713 TaxID=3145233 RepID=UPI00374E5BA4